MSEGPKNWWELENVSETNRYMIMAYGNGQNQH